MIWKRIVTVFYVVQELEIVVYSDPVMNVSAQILQNGHKIC